MFPFLLLQELGQVPAHPGGVPLQVLLLDDVEDGEPDGARHRVPAKLRGSEPARGGRAGSDRRGGEGGRGLASPC